MITDFFQLKKKIGKLIKRKELINQSFITEYSVILIANFEVRRAEMVRKKKKKVCTSRGT